MKHFMICSLLFLFISCEEYDIDTFEVAGLYQARIVGLNGSFEMPITIEFGDELTIEAPFDGTIWDVVYADIDCNDCEIKEIYIDRQRLEDGVFISGSGAYSYGTIQLDYDMSIFDENFSYSLVGSK